MENKIILNTPNPKNAYYSSGSTELSYIVGSAIHNMIKFYVSKLPIGHFKYIHKEGALALRESKMLKSSTSILLKKEKPVLGVSHRINLKDNQLFESNYFTRPMGTHGMFLNRHWLRDLQTFTDCVLHDQKDNVHLNFTVNYLTLNIDFTHIYETSMQQLETFWSIIPLFDLAPAQFEFFVKFPIPERFIEHIATIKGFKISVDKERGNQIENPLEFTKELNKFTNYPVSYERDTGTGRFRYFVTAKTIYCIRFNKPEADEGERKNKVMQNFKITHNVECDILAPNVWYFIYQDERFEPEFIKIEQPDLVDLELNSITYDWLPHVDENDFTLVGYSGYEFDSTETKADIDLREIIFDRAFNAYKLAENKGINLSEYISPKLFINKNECKDTTKFYFDKDKFRFHIYGNMSEDYVIALYLDMNTYKVLEYNFNINKSEDGAETSEYLTGRE